MNNYSLDTNLVIPLINETDHNRNIVINIIKKEKDNCVICSNVIREVKIILRDKIALTIEKSLKILFKLKDIEDAFERNKFLIDSFKNLMDKDSYLKNFYSLLYEKINLFLKDNDVDALPSYLSELSDNMTRVVIPSIYNYVDFHYIMYDYSDNIMMQKFFKIDREISSIRFRDNYDKAIFHELAVFANVEFIINCYTHDKEFTKKADKAISILEKEVNYAPKTLIFTYV